MTKTQLMAENNSLKEETRELKEEIDEVKGDMVDMYEIIANDKGMTSISLDQPLKDIARFNITTMLEKFKVMSDVIEGGLEDGTLILDLSELKREYNSLIEKHNSLIEEHKVMLLGHRGHFNMMIDLIKGCDTDEKLQKLKELNKLDEE